MVKKQSISQVVDEIKQSILETAKKQRRIRSGTFWNKFGFERRTKERVESVKNEFDKQSISIHLEDSVFGLEKRGDLIVFSQSESKNIKSKPKQPESYKQQNDNEIVFDDFHKFENIVKKLQHLTTINQDESDYSVVFSIIFAELFCKNTPSYELSGGGYGATRSNWTYHTAIAISETCRILNLTCKFEAQGKRDAIIETNTEIPEVILAAEWEWDYADIFGNGKELEKLKESCKANPTANAILLIYCPISKYLDYLEKIAEYWIKETSSEEQPPALFLHTVIFELKGNIREFMILKTVMIDSLKIVVWGDRYL